MQLIPQDIKDMVLEAAELTNNLEDGMTKFQIENFIIGAEPTVEGKYHQCLRELETRVIKIRQSMIKKQYLEVMNFT